MPRRTAAQKAEIVGLAEVVGIRPAAARTGVPESSIRYWQASPEFAQLRAAKREDVAQDVWAAFQTGVRRIVELLPATEDIGKAAIATGVLYDKFALMSGQATGRTEHRSLTDDITDSERERLRDWIEGLPAAPRADPSPTSG